MAEIQDGANSPPARDDGRRLSLRRSLIRLVPLFLVGLVVGIYGLYRSGQPDGADRGIFLVLGVASLAGVALLAFGTYQALSGQHRSGPNFNGEPTPDPDPRPTWLDSTWMVFVLLVATVMWTVYAAAALLTEHYGLAAANGLLLVASIWTARRILRRRQQRRMRLVSGREDRP